MDDVVDVGEWAAVRWQRPGYVELVASLVLAWGLGDTVSTVFAAAVVGPGREANPWIRALLVHHPLAVVAVKAAVVLYVGVVLLECRPVVERVPWWRAWLLAVVGVGALVSLSNTYVGLAGVAAGV